MNNPKILESACFSYPKSKAKENQDSILAPVQVQHYLYMAIADGVGGEYGGAIASSLAINTIRREIYRNPESNIKELFSLVQMSISDEASNNEILRCMATTLVICKISPNCIEIGSTGDSRAYFFDFDEPKILSKDHTEKQMLIDRQIFTEEDFNSSDAGKNLTSAINAQPNFELSYEQLPVSSGNVILMTDGTYQLIDIRTIVNQENHDLLKICSSIKQEIEKLTAKDDFSMVAMKF